MTAPRPRASLWPALAALSALCLSGCETAGHTPAAATSPCAPVVGTLPFDPPLVISRGGTYSGRWRSDDRKVPAVRVATTEKVVIENATVAGYGILIAAGTGADVTIRNTGGFGLARTAKGERPGAFAYFYQARNVLIENSYMEHVWGIRFDGFKGDGTDGATIRILRNKALDMDGALPNPAHFFQLAGVQSVGGIEVAWNDVVNEPYRSHVEDVINIYESSGTPASPIRIHDNFIDGAYPPDPAVDRYSGGGIMLGDGRRGQPAQKVSSWVEAYDNQVIDTTNYGIGIAAGHDNSIVNNRVFAAGTLPGGKFMPAQNVGLAVWDSHREPATFFGNNARANVVAWNRKDEKTGRIIRNDFWFPDCAAGKCTGNTHAGKPETAEAERALWDAKLAARRISVGPSACSVPES